MGSGHFLVSLVDYIADRALEAIDRAEQDADEHCGMEYRSPLAAELAEMREKIIRRSKRPLESEQLGDRLLMRRLVLKRVIYGADKNPLAAELAKLSLWLHTFTVSAPPAFPGPPPPRRRLPFRAVPEPRHRRRQSVRRKRNSPKKSPAPPKNPPT